MRSYKKYLIKAFAKLEEQTSKKQLQKSDQRELLPTEIVLPSSPQIVISSKDLPNLSNLEPILNNSKEFNLTIINEDVYIAQTEQDSKLKKEIFEQEESAKEASHRRTIEWVDNIFLKILNLLAFAAGFYLVTHDNIMSGDFLLGGALYPLAKEYVLKKFAGTFLGKEDIDE